MTPNPKPVQMQLTPAADPDRKIQKLTGKYSRLRRELSPAMRASYSQAVCSVTVIDPADMHEGSESGLNIDGGFDIDSTNNTIEGDHIVAAHMYSRRRWFRGIGYSKNNHRAHRQWPVKIQNFGKQLS